MKKVTVIGSLNMDLTTFTDVLPKVGETVIGAGFNTSYGGKGGNQACAAAKLGGAVNMLGCVGYDSYGAALIRNLEQAGVDCSRVNFCQKQRTGTASITVCNGDNSIIIVPGANGTVDVPYIKANLDAVDQADLLLLQLEIPLETVLFVCDYAQTLGIPIMLNPSPAIPLPEDIFEQLEYLIVNEAECEFYTGVHIESVSDAKKGLSILLNKGCKNVIVTLGKVGSVYNEGSSLVYEPAIPVRAVDSTSAGDTFTAAAAVYLIDGSPIGAAVKFATRASSITVTRPGAQESMPTLDEVMALCDS